MSNHRHRVAVALGGIPEALRGPGFFPLVIGTRDALAARLEAVGMPAEVAGKLAANFLADHCRQRAYLAALAADEAARVDLDGNLVEAVTDEARRVAMVGLLVCAFDAHAKALRAAERPAPVASDPAPKPAPPPPPAYRAPPKAEAPPPRAVAVTTKRRYPQAPMRSTSAPIGTRR